MIVRHPDLDATRALLTEAGLLSSDLEPEMLSTFLGWLEDGILIAVGGLEIHGTSALVRSVVTARTHHGKGVASTLLDALETLAREHEVEHLFLLTETAERFFEKRSYEPFDRDEAPPRIAKTSQFRDLCPASATLMHKRLEPGPAA